MGETFDEGEIGARFGVGPRGGIRVSRKKCIVLVDRTDGGPGCENADGGSTVEYTGRNQPGDDRGDRDQVLAGENLILSRSKEDGYAVLYFKKDGEGEDALRFDGLVEYESHGFKDVKTRGGRTRSALVFKLGTVRGQADDPKECAGGMRGTAAPRGAPSLDLVETVEREISGPRPPEDRSQLLKSLSDRTDAEPLDRILGYLERSAKITADGDAVRWSFDPAGSGAAGSGRGEGAREAAAGSAGAAGGARVFLTWGEMETMNILADDGLANAIAESEEDMRAGRVTVWNPEEM